MRHKDEKRLVFGCFFLADRQFPSVSYFGGGIESLFFSRRNSITLFERTYFSTGWPERESLLGTSRGEQPTCAIGSRPNARRRSHTDHRTLWTNFGREKLGKEGERRRMPFFFEKPLIYARLSFRLEESGGK